MPSTLVMGSSDIASLVRSLGADELMDRMIEALEEALSADELPADAGEVTRPIAPGMLARFDRTSGALLALADAVMLSALRAGAVAAVATRALVSHRPRRLGIVGCGPHGVTQCHAHDRIFQFDEIVCFDADPRAAEGFASRVPGCAAPGRVVGFDELTDTADVICVTAGSGRDAPPVLDAVGAATHINVLGSRRDRLPLSDRLLATATVVPDAIARPEPGAVGPDLPTVLRTKPSLRPSGLTVFESTDAVVEDHIALDLLLGLAAELDLGSILAVTHPMGGHLAPYEAADPS